MSNSEGDTGTQALPLCVSVPWAAWSQQISLAMNSQGHDIFQKQWGRVESKHTFPLCKAVSLEHLKLFRADSHLSQVP